MGERFLKIGSVAEVLDVDIETVRKWVKERRFKTYRFGRAVRLRLSDVMDFAVITPSIDELKEEIGV